MMYPLLIAALIALTVIIERMYCLLKRYKTPVEFVEKTLALARAGRSSPAL